MKNNILLVIAARGGSVGVKDKNIRPLAGKPLIAHTIEQAKKWGKADYIICSTDSDKIAQVAQECGADVPFMRPSNLAENTTGKLDVLKHTLKKAQDHYGCTFDVVVDLDATAPVRKIDDIDHALRIFEKNKPDSVVSVTPCRKNPYFNMLEMNSDGFVKIVKYLDGPINRRQDAPEVYEMNASIYVYDAQYLLSDRCHISISNKSLPVVMDEYSSFDIDTEQDFQFIEFLVDKGLVQL